MKSTITYKPEDILEWESSLVSWCQDSSECDILCFKIAKFFACQGRAYKTQMGVTLDTLSIHSNNPDEIGIRFYHKNQKAHNRRGAFFAEFTLPVDNVLEQINEDGFVTFCSGVADEAVHQILEQMKK